MRGWKKIFHAKGNDKKAEVAILISQKTDFKKKGYSKRQRIAVYSDKGINTRRGHYTH